MKVYVAGISGEQQFVKSLRTFYEIATRPGDFKQERALGRGDVTRMLASDEFMFGDYDAFALWDLDMLHPPDALERLRSHDKDMVTGHYYARNGRVVHSIWWDYGNGKWPYPPIVKPPTSGLHKIGMTGMGCVLIKRQVIVDVANWLPHGDHPFAIGAAPQITGDSRSLGTDFRFFSVAQHLGYELWGDADVQCDHAVTIWLDHDKFDRLYDNNKMSERLNGISTIVEREQVMDDKILKMRVAKWDTQIKSLTEQRERFIKNLGMIDKQLIAVKAIKSEDEYLLSRVDNSPFPTVPEPEREKVLEERTSLRGVSEQEARELRDDVLQREAREFVDDIQTLRTAE